MGFGPTESDNPPPSPDVQSPSPPSSSKNPETPPSESPSPPSPPSEPTKPSPTQPSGPAHSPPAHPNAPPSPFHTPPRCSGASSGPVVSPSLTAPNKETPTTSSVNGNNNGYQGNTMVGKAVAGFMLMALIAIFFFVRRKKKRSLDIYGHSQYLPPPNFPVKSDPAKGYCGPGGSVCNSQQQSTMGNSYGSQSGHHRMQSSGTPNSAFIGGGQTHFSYEELADITQGFARQNILGEGGFGCVYKGTLHNGKVVAVKQLKAGSGQGDREFKAEVIQKSFTGT